ncbi:LytR/AlgR family response regulator transcription factor [Lutispora sp.]|uniref:LytR/AlgR family response regulator transcription factor n=1 Tax=Lutispora sp. TaxID=2828727 RepID=UPI00356A9F9A
MAIKIAICDDNKEDAELLEKALYNYDDTFEIIAYNNGEMLIDDFLDDNISADILFLDIYMPGIDGVKTAERIRSRNKDIKIIFTSLSKDHFQQAYEVFAFNYILKPLNIERLYCVLDRALDELRSENNYKISFKYKSSIHIIDWRDILYMESQDKLILFHMTDGSKLQCYGKLDDIEPKLPEESFIRCHQSFIVNAAHINKMGEAHFSIGQVMISISKKRLKHAKEKYYTYLFSHMGRGYVE